MVSSGDAHQSRRAQDRTATEADPQLADLAGRLRTACMRISRRVRFEHSHGIPPHQFAVLARLNEAGEATPGELAHWECVSPPSMSKTVAALVEAGLVQRQQSAQDGRQVRLQLTAAGQATLSEVRQRRDEWMLSRVAALTPKERSTLQQASEILTRIAAQ